MTAQQSPATPMSKIEGPKTLAIVSGKGGSGKTLFATALMMALDRCGLRVILVDGDLGTGGCSYFLGLENVRSIQSGLSDVLYGVRRISSKSTNSPQLSDDDAESEAGVRPETLPSRLVRSRVGALIEQSLQNVYGTEKARFLPIGSKVDPLDESPDAYERYIGGVIEYLSSLDVDIVLIDCRGGIDRDSLAVCRVAKGTLLIAETDAASIQAGQRLIRLVSEHNNVRKSQNRSRRLSTARLVGFVINKAFSDPSQLAQTGSSFFKTNYLGAIPFDFQTTRRFIFGKMPSRDSVFSTHLAAAVQKIYPELTLHDQGVIWSGADYETLSMNDLNSLLGGRVCVAFSIMSLYVYAITVLPIIHFGLADGFSWQWWQRDCLLGISIFFGLVGCTEQGRKFFGRISRAYLKSLTRIFMIGSGIGKANNI